MNVFQYGAIEEKIWENMLEGIGSYRRKTTFYSDLSLAEWTSGAAGVRSTFNSVMKSWLKDIKYITEFVMCLNHKAWEFADEDYLKRSVKLPYAKTKESCQEFVALYNELYEQAYDKVVDYYTNAKRSDDLSYFYETLD
jgi:hypothetical protein